MEEKTPGRFSWDVGLGFTAWGLRGLDFRVMGFGGRGWLRGYISFGSFREEQRLMNPVPPTALADWVDRKLDLNGNSSE